MFRDHSGNMDMWKKIWKHAKQSKPTWIQPPEAEELQAFGPHTLHIFHVLQVYVFIVIRYLSSKNNMGLIAHRYGFRLVENGGMDPYSCSRPYMS